MNIYCSSSIKQYLERNETEDYCHTEAGVVAPTINMNKLYEELDSLRNTWKFELQNAQADTRPLMRFIKKVMYKLSAWMMAGAAAQQAEFNLAVVHFMEDVLKELDYDSKKKSVPNKNPLLFLCLDPIEQKSNLQEMLAAFQYYLLHYNNNAYMVFLNEKAGDDLYLEFLRRTANEFRMRNVEFLITKDRTAAEEYARKAFLQISFYEKNTERLDNLRLLQFSTTEKNWKDGEIIVDELDIQEIAKIMHGMEIEHEKDTCH